MRVRIPPSAFLEKRPLLVAFRSRLQNDQQAHPHNNRFNHRSRAPRIHIHPQPHRLSRLLLGRAILDRRPHRSLRAGFRPRPVDGLSLSAVFPPRILSALVSALLCSRLSMVCVFYFADRRVCFFSATADDSCTKSHVGDCRTCDRRVLRDDPPLRERASVGHLFALRFVLFRG